MFAYCGNNPVSRIDSYGASWWQDFWSDVRDWLAEGKEDNSQERGTIAAGYSGSIAFGFSGTFGFGVTADKRGNAGLILFVNYGGGMPSASVNGFITITNAPDIYKTTGMGTEVGASVSAGPISIGGEYVMLIDSETGETYHGGTYLGGMSPPKLPIPAELHGGASQTWMPLSINIYDIAISIIDHILL
jgi:hypothetical protein